MLSSMAAQALHNQLQKPCLLSVPVSSRFPTMMFCADDRCGDPPTVRQGSVRKVTHEKRTSGSNALLAPTQILPPTSCRAAASAHGSLPNSASIAVRLRQTALANVGTSSPCAYAHTCAYVCASTRSLLLPHPSSTSADAASLPTRASIPGTHTPST